MDMLAAPPANATRYSPQPPRECSPRQAHSLLQGRQVVTVPRGAAPGPDREIIIAVMGVTGKIQSLFKPALID